MKHLWIGNFKKVRNIVSRKITKFITLQAVLQALVWKSNVISNSFFKNIEFRITDAGTNNAYNVDESVFNLEVYFGRILAVKSQKTVKRL